jgi:hypothetical protein
MHARLVDLLSLRDGERVDPAIQAHVARCAECSAALAATSDLADRLRTLPQAPAAGPGAWSLLERRIASRDGRLRRRDRLAPWAAAASVAALALFASLRTSERPPSPEIDPSRVATEPAGDAVTALQARSQVLEAVLAALPARPAVERAGTSLPIETLEAQVQWLDHQITATGATYAPSDEERLWRDRVEILNSLVQLRYVEAQHTRM